MISISGLSANELTSSKGAKLNISTLREWIANGAFALNVESVYPTESLPAHATIVTGLLPTDHGITANIAFDEHNAIESNQEAQQTRSIKADSIMEAAHRENLKVANFSFPISSNNEINFSSIASLLPSYSRKERLSAIKDQDNKTAFEAIESLKQNRPELLLVHFDSYALSQTYFGVASREAIDALANIDALLKQIFEAVTREGLINNTTFIVVSDHGLMKVEHEFSPDSVLIRKGFLKVDQQGNVISWRAKAQTFGGSAAIYLQNPADEQTARAVEAAFQEIYQQISSPIWRILTRREAARLGADPRAFLYLDAAPGLIMTEAKEISTDQKDKSESVMATGGYLP
ncbi:MAG TPA: alkaline phosphatase family protein, partial [Blastocatellia bacterium]|nr:alkaline phosphatase family protein [Blastocatellia bacterium]